jgi:hypothetical protein
MFVFGSGGSSVEVDILIFIDGTLLSLAGRFAGVSASSSSSSLRARFFGFFIEAGVIFAAPVTSSDASGLGFLVYFRFGLGSAGEDVGAGTVGDAWLAEASLGFLKLSLSFVPAGVPLSAFRVSFGMMFAKR